MMISPESYRNENKNKDLQVLLKERKKLYDEIQKYENEYILGTENNTNTISYIITDPSPEVIYKCNNLYLIEITKLIKEKMEEL